MDDHWIQEAHIKEGALTAQAKRAHMEPLEFAQHVLDHPDKYTITTRHRANFALNIQKRKGGAKPVEIPYTDFLKEHHTLLGVLKRPTKAKLLSEYKDQSAELKKVIGMRGGAMPESREVLGDIAQSTYTTSNTPINGWAVVVNTPTIKAYKKDNAIIIAVRGTNVRDRADLSADASIVVNNLVNTPRYRRDVEIIKRIRQQYPNAVYYAVGHSLGGAIVDNLINDGLVSEGLSFNPAVESKFYNDTRNSRIAHKDDPLYALMSHNARGTTVVNTPLAEPKHTGISWLDSMVNKVANKFSITAEANKRLKAHTIGAIFGRGSCGKSGASCKCASAFKDQLDGIGYNCSQYLSDARAVAKRAGYDPARLEFSNDKDHKLMYVAPDGSIRRFGRLGYGDFLTWTYMEREYIVPKGTARKKRTAFHKSHEAIKGEWRNDRYSPNNLALHINW